ncbi:TPA: 2,4-dihydroxyhept-2-ene-1,7-dioic acid aldolase [Candidatus Poribacteria bacterium]|nr:2,4-dihydroxyhept-2-ene-1,7-dioic acid aldolase [Candidatus Poribacteria bacterium]
MSSERKNMKPNRLRQLLNEGKPTLGTHVICPWPGIIEIIGNSGVFDYIEYVGEYAPFSLEQMDDFGRTIELFPNMSSMMKVEEQTRGFIAQRAIDSGIQNVLFTDIRSAEDARECVRLVRPETPESGGVHGAAMRRSVGYVLGAGSAEWAKSLNETVIALMIEKKGAMDELDEILAVPGIDMVQFGPTDYSISIGKPGGGGSPEVQEAHIKMIKKALSAGVHPRVELGSFDQAKRFLDMGVRHFCVGWDVRIIFDWCKQQGKIIDELGIKK